MSLFARRIERLSAFFEAAGRLDDDEDLDEEDGPVSASFNAAALMERIVFVDESVLVLHPKGKQGGIRALQRASAQARHLRYLILYAAQITKYLPLDFLNCEAIFVKKPNGWERESDRQEPLALGLWERAREAFAGVRHQPYWDAFPDERMWVWAEAPGCGPHGFRGLLPVLPPQEGA
jgi:hypothetical protein